MSKIVRVDSGNYKIGVQSSGTITLDTGWQVGTTVLTGRAMIHGDAIETDRSTFNLLPYNATTVNFAGTASTINIGAPIGVTNVNGDLVVFGHAMIHGADDSATGVLNTSSTVFELLNTTATDVYAFGQATNVVFGALTGNTLFNHSVIVTGDLTVNGTTTTVNSTDLSVDDKNITLAATASPTDAAATGGGITLKGTTDKTLNWELATTSWTSSENVDLAISKVYKIDTIDVLSYNSVLTNPTTVTAFSNATTTNISAATGNTTIRNNLVVDLDLQVKGGDLTTDQTTFNLLNATATTVNFAGAATSLNIGDVAGLTTLRGDVAILGNDLTSTSATFNLLNGPASPTTINAFGQAATINIGASGSTLTIYNLATEGDIEIRGGDLTTNQTTFNLLNTTATTVNAFGAATTLNVGAAGSITYLNGDLQVKGGDLTTDQTTFNLLESTATTVNAFGAATTLSIATSALGGTYNFATADNGATAKTINIGTGGTGVGATNITIGSVSAGTTTINSSTLVGAALTQNLFNTTATAVNAFGAASLINIGVNATTGGTYNFATADNGSSSKTVNVGTGGTGAGLTNINIGSSTAGTTTINSGTIVGSSTTQTLFNTVATTVNAFGAASMLIIGGKNGSSQTDIATGDNTGGTKVVNLGTGGSAGGTTNINIGIAGGTTTVNSSTLVGSSSTQDLFNTVATTINAFGAATSITVGASGGVLYVTGDLQVKGGDLTTDQAAFNLLNTTATTVNAFGEATSVEIGAATGTTNINNNLVVDGTGTITGNATINGVNFIKLPVGTTAQRSGESGQPAASAGHMRFNSSVAEVEAFDGLEWRALGATAFKPYTTSTTAPFVLDSFDKGLYRSAKYTLQLQDPVSTQIVELHVFHNDIQATVQTVKSSELGGPCATFTAQITGSNIELVLTPAYDVVEIQYSRMFVIKNTSPVIGTINALPITDLQNGTYTIDLEANLPSTIDLNA